MANKEKRKLTLESSTKSLALKFYDEQLIESFGTADEKAVSDKFSEEISSSQLAIKTCPDPVVKQQLEATFDARLKVINDTIYGIVDNGGYWERLKTIVRSLDKSVYQCYAILHDRDFKEDDFFVPSAEKRHYHLIIRYTPVQGVHRVPYKVRSWLNLVGIKYRKGFDESLVLNKGIQSVGDFPAYLLYLTHGDEKSILAGKAPYDKSELVSNCIDSYDDILSGYSGNIVPHKLSREEYERVFNLAYEYGLSGRSFDTFVNDINRFLILSSSKLKVLERNFSDGLRARITQHNEIDRLVLFIEGDANLGKSYNVRLALEELGVRNPLFVTNSGSGKYDALSIDNDALVLDDVTGKDMLNVSDQYECSLYKRNSGDAVWGGRYLIVTNNHNFRDWLIRSLGLHLDSDGNLSEYDEQTLAPCMTRFYAVKLRERPDGVHAVLSSVFKRGNSDKQARIKAMYDAFMSSFLGHVNEYRNKNNSVADGFVTLPSTPEWKGDFFV